MPNTRRILYLHPHNWYHGPHQSLRALIAGLDRTRFSPLVLLPKRDVATEEFVKLGAKVCFDPGVRFVPRSVSPIAQSEFWVNLRRATGRLKELIGSHGVDLLHSNSEACWVGGFAARAAGIPAISHLRTLSPLSPSWAGWVTARILSSVNQALIAPSDADNGINPSIFDPSGATPTLRSELGIRNGRPLIGMIGNFHPRKGHHDFIAACAMVHKAIPESKFVIVGTTERVDQDYYQHVQELVSAYKLDDFVYFLGVRADIPDVLFSLDVVVQPSHTEAGPRVPIESMAMERPIVVTDVGGNSEEIINGETGLVVPVGDTKSLAGSVVKLLNDVCLARRLGTAGRQRVLTLFTEKAHALRVQQLYGRLLPERCI